ncbi:hypothetical protein AKJ09_06357 [Labilithrix luteola]|uniref:Uncharacterized protein n=1 Tax=Labilithrix luteola TaxID=1391654 RepID=A0A0K1Q1N4_9BACT|nr:hypothetical protein AKJ09_06357 [Labilithrix luteola]
MHPSEPLSSRSIEFHGVIAISEAPIEAPIGTAIGGRSDTAACA